MVVMIISVYDNFAILELWFSQHFIECKQFFYIIWSCIVTRLQRSGHSVQKINSSIPSKSSWTTACTMSPRLSMMILQTAAMESWKMENNATVAMRRLRSDYCCLPSLAYLLAERAICYLLPLFFLFFLTVPLRTNY